jgi:hypothetical protein
VNDTAAYIIEILIDDMGMEPEEAVQTLAETIIIVAKQAANEDLLEMAGEMLADA